MGALPNSEHEWAYLAGFVDADGAITVSRYRVKKRKNPQYGLRLAITNCDRGIMNWLVTLFGGNICLANSNAPQHHRTLWRWSLSGSSVEPVLVKLLPYLKVKDKQAEFGILFAKTIGGNTGVRLTTATKRIRESIYTNLKRMNKRGRFR